MNAIDFITNPRFYDEAGLELVSNSPEEILAAVREMHQRVKGEWIVTAEEEDTKAAFVDLIREFYPGYPEYRSNPAFSFFKMNPYLVKGIKG